MDKKTIILDGGKIEIEGYGYNSNINYKLTTVLQGRDSQIARGVVFAYRGQWCADFFTVGSPTDSHIVGAKSLLEAHDYMIGLLKHQLIARREREELWEVLN